MKRLKNILQDDMVRTTIAFVVIWASIVAAVLVPLSPMMNW